MKRIFSPAAVALMLLGTAACGDLFAYSQTTVWNGNGSDSDMNAAGRVCDSKVGEVLRGRAPTEAYKQCMRAQGWEYEKSTRMERYQDSDGRVIKDVYIDNDTGRVVKVVRP